MKLYNNNIIFLPRSVNILLYQQKTKMSKKNKVHCVTKTYEK